MLERGKTSWDCDFGFYMLASCTLAGKPALQEKALERFLSNLSEEARSAFTLSICDVLCGCDGTDGIWNNKLHTLNYLRKSGPPLRVKGLGV